MSGFDPYLCHCKPRVKTVLAERLATLSAKDAEFVFRHQEWQIEQFLSLVITAGMDGAMRYLHNYGGQGTGLAGMTQGIDFRAVVKERFSDGKPYTYLAVAKWIADIHKVLLDKVLKQRVYGTVINLVQLEELFNVSDYDAHNHLHIYSTQRGATVKRKPPQRYRAWALEVKHALEKHGALTTGDIANLLCAEIEPLQRKAITDALNSLYRQGLVEYRGAKGVGRQYALVNQEAMKCCG